MRTDVCALCGALAVVSDPESEPPYVHLTCVLSNQTASQYPKMMSFRAMLPPRPQPEAQPLELPTLPLTVRILFVGRKNVGSGLLHALIHAIDESTGRPYCSSTARKRRFMGHGIKQDTVFTLRDYEEHRFACKSCLKALSVIREISPESVKLVGESSSQSQEAASIGYATPHAPGSLEAGSK